MDFALPYTEEQQRFRQEVRTWIEKNVPGDKRDPIDPGDWSPELFRFWREKHQEIAKKGWLYPTLPKEYGGGGLSGDHETIIEEEFARARIPGNFTSANVIPGIMVWGTEEQKQRILKPILLAEKVCWHKLTEPKGGADLANYQGRAVRDGDDWLLTGQNVFIGSYGQAELLGGIIMTDSDAPRHRNLGYFFIPVPSEGLVIKDMNLLPGRVKHAIFMENVRVPGENLIGGDHQGWQVENTNLEQEHGGRGSAFPSKEEVENLLSYIKETKIDGNSLGSNSVLQQTAMDTYIDAQVDTLLLKRTFALYQQRVEINHEGSLSNVHNRLSDIRNHNRIREVMGMYALLGNKDPRAPHAGAQEVDQREKAGQRHPGGTNNIAKVILARRIGISRTRERAAPTPATATTGGA